MNKFDLYGAFRKPAKMSKNCFTPGPWRATKNYMILAGGSYDEKPEHIAEVYGSSWHPEKVADANARLIAASPEMLFSLKEMVEYDKNCPDRNDDCPRCVAKYVIAKAEGKEIIQ